MSLRKTIALTKKFKTTITLVYDPTLDNSVMKSVRSLASDLKHVHNERVSLKVTTEGSR